MELGILYCCIHKKVAGKCGLSGIITKDKFCRMLGEVYHVPKPLRNVILKEMESLKMITLMDTVRCKHIKINPVENDPEENVSTIYRRFGFY